MAITAFPYPLSFRGLGYGRFDFLNQTYKAMLTTAAYVPDPDFDEFLDDVTSEITGVGDTAGGKTLSGKTWRYDADNNLVVLRFDPLVWTNASFTLRRLVIYCDTGTPATSPLLSWVDFGTDVSPNSVDWPVTFTNGIYGLRTGSV